MTNYQSVRRSVAKVLSVPFAFFPVFVPMYHDGEVMLIIFAIGISIGVFLSAYFLLTVEKKISKFFIFILFLWFVFTSAITIYQIVT